jgi:hypothetical protein
MGGIQFFLYISLFFGMNINFSEHQYNFVTRKKISGRPNIFSGHSHFFREVQKICTTRSQFFGSPTKFAEPAHNILGGTQILITRRQFYQSRTIFLRGTMFSGHPNHFFSQPHFFGRAEYFLRAQDFGRYTKFPLIQTNFYSGAPFFGGAVKFLVTGSLSGGHNILVEKENFLHRFTIF